MTMHRRFSATLLAAVAGLALATGSARADVTYEEVLANPGDLQLSYTYAREQIRAGKLEQAAGALERMLLLEPNWDSARLLYAIVLYRLDDLEGAKRELAILQGRPLDSQMEDQVDRYLAKAEQKSQSVRVSGALSVGVGVDSNPTLASTGESAEYFADFPFSIILPEEEQESDTVFVGEALLRIESDLNTGRGDYLYVQGRGRLQEQIDQHEVDFARAEAEAGAKLFFGDLSFNPAAYYAAIGLGDEFLRHEYGGRLDIEYVVTPGFAILAGGGGAWLDYDEEDEETYYSFGEYGASHDGWRAWGGGGFRTRLGENNTFQAQARYHQRESDEDAYSYHGYEIALRDRQLLGLGQYLLIEANYWHLEYEEGLYLYDDSEFDEFDIQLPAREDDRVKARIAYGLPVSLLLDVLGSKDPSAFSTFNLQASVGYFWQDSNVESYDTENWSGELLLTKRFGL